MTAYHSCIGVVTAPQAFLSERNRLETPNADIRWWFPAQTCIYTASALLRATATADFSLMYLKRLLTMWFQDPSYIPFLIPPSGGQGYSPVDKRKQGPYLSRVPERVKGRPSSGVIAWSMWGQSSFASAALATSPFSFESSNI